MMSNDNSPLKAGRSLAGLLQKAFKPPAPVPSFDDLLRQIDEIEYHRREHMGADAPIVGKGRQ
jgi:hypothetical protein